MQTNPQHTGSASLAAAAVGLCLVPALFAADTLAGICAGWRPVGAIEHLILVSAAMYALAAASILLRKSSRQWIARHGYDAALLAAGSCIAWGLLECGADRLEIKLRFQTTYHTRGPNLHRSFIPDPAYLPGILKPALFSTDARGIRAPYPPNAACACRILCLGGSTTECVYLDDAETWAAQLMNILNEQRGAETVWIGNAGISGFDTHEHLLFLKQSPLVPEFSGVLLQTGINDLWRYLAREENRIRYDRFSATPPRPIALPSPTPYRPVWTRSRVIQLYHSYRTKLNSPPESTKIKEEIVEGNGGREYRLRREKREAAPIVDTLPDLAPGLRAYRDRILDLIQTAQRRGIAIAFTTQPVLWQKGLPPDIEKRCWFGWLENGQYLSLAALRTAMDEYNRTLIETCRENQTPCIDLSEMNGHPEFFYDDCHFTSNGAKEVARRIAAQFPSALCGQSAEQP